MISQIKLSLDKNYFNKLYFKQSIKILKIMRLMKIKN